METKPAISEKFFVHAPGLQLCARQLQLRINVRVVGETRNVGSLPDIFSGVLLAKLFATEVLSSEVSSVPPSSFTASTTNVGDSGVGFCSTSDDLICARALLAGSKNPRE